MSKKSAPVSAPAPLPEVHIVELSCSSENSVSNAEWSVILPKGINIDDGDQISIKTGFVNQNSLTGGNIDIPEDITIAMEAGFYVINGLQFCRYSAVNSMQYYDLPTWETQPGPPHQQNFDDNGNLANIVTDGELYVWHQSVPVSPQYPSGYQPIIERTEIPLEAGSYTPQQISTIITSRLSSMNGKDLQGDGPPVLFDYQRYNSGSNFLQNACTDVRATSTWMSTYTNSAWDAATVRRFTYVEQAFGPAPLAPESGGPGYALDPTYFVGATQLALDYDDVSEAFQWSFLHTPMADPAGTGSIANALYRSSFLEGGNQFIGPLSYQTRQSGIFFTKLEPESFWEALGFSIGETVVDISDGISTTEVKAKTTDSQLGLSTIVTRAAQPGLLVIDQNFDFIDTPTIPFLQYITNDNILPLKAQNTYSASNNGFYLVSLDLGTINSFSDDNKVYGGISGIVGKYFEANDFVTVMSDSAIPYIHNGASFTLSNVKVRILDQNKDPVRGLRGNSSIFLQIIKGG